MTEIRNVPSFDKFISKIHQLCTHISGGGGDFPEKTFDVCNVTNGELYLHRFEHNGDPTIQRQRSHRNMLCFLHLLRCYTGSTRAVLGPWPGYINNTVNTPFVGLRKKGLHILEQSQFLYTSAVIPRVSALIFVRRRQCQTFIVTFLQKLMQ